MTKQSSIDETLESPTSKLVPPRASGGLKEVALNILWTEAGVLEVTWDDLQAAIERLDKEVV